MFNRRLIKTLEKRIKDLEAENKELLDKLLSFNTEAYWNHKNAEVTVKASEDFKTTAYKDVASRVNEIEAITDEQKRDKRDAQSQIRKIWNM